MRLQNVPFFWRFKDVDPVALIATPVKSALHAPSRLKDKLVFVDVGASSGIQAKWLPYAASLVPVLFEPNPVEAAKLRNSLSRFDAKIIEAGLSDRPGPQRLNIGAYYGCTSVLEADNDFLSDYESASLYRSIRTVEIPCVRYDALVSAGDAPAPDFIKIDIEGYETVALRGFGDLLHNVLGIETEAWFYPAYKNQGLLHDLIDLLAPYGLRLRRIETVPAFDGDMVVANAFFTCTRSRYATLANNRRAKFDLMARVLKLPPR